MSFDEASRGSLTPGKIADFVVLSENPLEIEPEQIKNVHVLDLYLAGKKYKTIRRGAFGLLHCFSDWPTVPGKSICKD